MDPIDAYFDFTCRFANRLHLWLRNVDVDVNWRPFSLLEAKQGDDGPPVWARREYADDISLLTLAGHQLVADHGGDECLDAGRVLAQMRAAGMHADDDQLRDGLELVGQSHGSAVARGVFGSSTIVFGSGRGSFVRLAGIPSSDLAGDILAALRTIAEEAPELDHLEPLRT